MPNCTVAVQGLLANSPLRDCRAGDVNDITLGGSEARWIQRSVSRSAPNCPVSSVERGFGEGVLRFNLARKPDGYSSCPIVGGGDGRPSKGATYPCFLATQRPLQLTLPLTAHVLFILSSPGIALRKASSRSHLDMRLRASITAAASVEPPRDVGIRFPALSMSSVITRRICSSD